VVTGEWRWIVSPLALDLALFYDVGTSATNVDALGGELWRSDWGIGARLHGPAATPVRMELAKGDEGWRLVFSGSAAF
jgi:hypothetical protein